MPLYDESKTYEENLIFGPFFSSQIPPRPTQEPTVDFLGFKLLSRIGVAACPLTLGKGIALLAQLGS